VINDFKFYPLGKRTGIELKIPPLDPGREYKINLIYTDSKDSKKFESLILPLTNSFLDNSKINVNSLIKFINLYDSITPESQIFEQGGVSEYISEIKCGDI